MSTRLDDHATTDGLPDLLTVEEAAALIRIGRTKAYAMAKQWRESKGASGLPVVDFGHVLRVPRAALEKLIGAELHAHAREAVVNGDAVGEEVKSARATRKRGRPTRPQPPASQLRLFQPQPQSPSS